MGELILIETSMPNGLVLVLQVMLVQIITMDHQCALSLNVKHKSIISNHTWPMDHSKLFSLSIHMVNTFFTLIHTIIFPVPTIMTNSMPLVIVWYQLLLLFMENLILWVKAKMFSIQLLVDPMTGRMIK